MSETAGLKDNRIPFPVWKLINSPKLTVGGCLCAAAVMFLFSIHLGLLVISFSYILAAYYIERRNLDALIIPPLAIFAVWNFFGGSLGPVLLAEDIFSWSVDPMLITHLVFALTFPVLILIYWAVNKNNPPVVILENGTIPQFLKSRRFQFIALAILGFAVVLEYMLINSGVADRGLAGDIILGTKYGFWSYFVAFSKLQYIAFLLIPYVYITSRGLTRYSLIAFLAIYATFQLANTNRGGLVFPFVFIVFGYWMVGGSFKRVILSFAFLLGVMSVLTPILGAFRGSGALEATALKDVGGRISLLLENKGEGWGGLSVFEGAGSIIGRAMLGCNDPIIYSDTPDTIPFAGWERFSGVLYLWMPSMFFPDKPSLLDGDYIRELYTGIHYERSSISISYPADLYRRFGWIGVLLGFPLYALAMSLFVRYGVRNAVKQKDKLWGLLVLFFITTFIHGAPFGSMLTTIWNFGYDYPKYLLVLWLLLFASKLIFKESVVVGVGR